MSTVADVIEKIRVEVEDDNDARWTDAKLVVLVQKAVDRMNKVLMLRGVKEAKKYNDFDTVVSTSEYALPGDCMIADSLYRIRTTDRTGWATKLVFHNDDQWERMSSLSAVETTNWRVWDGNIEIFETPSSVISLRLYYWPQIDFSSWTSASTMPWDGWFDEPVADYVAIRCRNIDEKNLQWDLKLLSDLSEDWIKSFSSLEPIADTVDGFYSNSYGWLGS